MSAFQFLINLLQANLFLNYVFVKIAFNISSQNAIYVHLFRYRYPERYRPRVLMTGQTSRCLFDGNKFKPKHNMKEGLREFIEWYQNELPYSKHKIVSNRIRLSLVYIGFLTYNHLHLLCN